MLMRLSISNYIISVEVNQTSSIVTLGSSIVGIFSYLMIDFFKVNSNKQWFFIYGYATFDQAGGASGQVIILNGNGDNKFSASSVGSLPGVSITNNAYIGNIYIGNVSKPKFHLANPIFFYNGLPPMASSDDYYFLALGDISKINRFS